MEGLGAGDSLKWLRRGCGWIGEGRVQAWVWGGGAQTLWEPPHLPPPTCQCHCLPAWSSLLTHSPCLMQGRLRPVLAVRVNCGL